jgi:hypothetical protein
VILPDIDPADEKLASGPKLRHSGEIIRLGIAEKLARLAGHHATADTLKAVADVLRNEEKREQDAHRAKPGVLAAKQRIAAAWDRANRTPDVIICAKARGQA